MFRRKEQPEPAQSHILNGTYVKVEPSKRGGFVEYRRDCGYIQTNQSGVQHRGISEIDISESYLTDRDEQDINRKRQEADKLNKSNRRKLPFLQKKKKASIQNSLIDRRNLNGVVGDGVNDDDDDISDITTYDEGLPVVYEGLKKNGLHPTTVNPALKRLDLDHQYAEEAQIFERMNYIVENYRQPPAYPGNSNADCAGKSMIQQLLQEKASKQIKDNASMINYCQVDAPKELSMEDLTKIMRSSHEGGFERTVNAKLSDSIGESKNSYTGPTSAAATSPIPEPVTIRKEDQLVMRTLRSPRTPEAARTGLHQQQGLDSSSDIPTQAFEFRNLRQKPEDISEIYPRDYDPDYDNDSAEELERDRNSIRNEENPMDAPRGTGNQDNAKESTSMADVKLSPRQNYIVDVLPSYSGVEERTEMAIKPYVMPPDYHQHPERDYEIHDRVDYDNLDSAELQSGSSFLISHLYEKSETFVPPSPYMYAEIPEWLQVYAKASPDLDEYLKWDMFRLPELDCWQTMLKRLYMKELEQVVFWFEEYRQAMQQEMEKRERDMGIMRVSMPVLDSRMKKTDV